MGNNVKIVGYAQPIYYGDQIQYTNFSPNVGLQPASNGGTTLFTMGNFAITTNLNPKFDKSFLSNKFSNFITLSTLNLSVAQTQTLLANNTTVTLNLDNSNLDNYALFGSLTEFIRVSLEDIIINWPASLYLSPLAQNSAGQTINGLTFENYVYDPISEVSSFKINTTFITNNFSLNYLANSVIFSAITGNTITTGNTFTNTLRNVSLSYNSYAILYKTIEYPIIGFTGSTYITNDYMYLQVQGNVFSGIGTTSNISYHIKPIKLIEEQFFNNLPVFENYLLNRQIIPAYTSEFKYPIESDDGTILYVTDTLTWPVSDGYNIDFDTTAYSDYATALLNISTDNDLYESDLITRFLVADSITSFDTSPLSFGSSDQDNTGQKVTKLLRIYGREFDEINNYISGIAFANTVTYDKKNNTPDVYLKELAKVMGWNLISSVAENDLLASYITTSQSSYSGHSVGYTSAEADIELWRRLILNTPWIWKSKGTRKAVEFFLKFIGAPIGLIKFNEYIYVANAPIDINLFSQALELNGLDSSDLTMYPIDPNGYPSPLPNTPNMYFQNYGLWFRETGGSGSTVDNLKGNNPHVGPYDGGYAYINQFVNLIPNFSAVTLSSQTITTGSDNLFTNYALGTINNYSGNTYIDSINLDGSSLGDCIVVTPTIIPNPIPVIYTNSCGCAPAEENESLSICVNYEINPKPPCLGMPVTPVPYSTNGYLNFSYYQYDINGDIIKDTSGNPILINSPYTSQVCCEANAGTPFLVPEIYPNGGNPIVVNTGYFCCDNSGYCGCSLACSWVLDTTVAIPTTSPSNVFLVFKKLDGSLGVVTPDGCNCIGTYTVKVPNITDPYTGQIGVGCQLTTLGKSDILYGSYGVIHQTYTGRANNTVPCNSGIGVIVVPIPTNNS